MAVIRITKEFTFEMAHALWNYDGLCSNIHGHSYKLAITVTGKPEEDQTNPKYGMVLDFNVLKNIVKTHILSKYDHSLVVSKQVSVESLKNTAQMFDRMQIIDGQPTCENLLIEFAKTISAQLPGTIKLFSIKLSETDNSYAEWYASDNE